MKYNLTLINLFLNYYRSTPNNKTSFQIQKEHQKKDILPKYLGKFILRQAIMFKNIEIIEIPLEFYIKISFQDANQDIRQNFIKKHMKFSIIPNLLQSFLQKMAIWNIIRRAVSASDFFYSSSMLKFERQNDYKTVTGGLVSLAIIIVIIVSFAKEILITFQKSTITVKNSIIKTDIPTSSTITFSPQNQMFAVYIHGASLKSNIRYFDVNAFFYEMTAQDGGGIVDFYMIDLVPCTKQHWEGYDVTFIFSMESLLCPSIGTSSQLYGKLSSGSVQSITLQVTMCNSYSSDIPCASESQIADFWSINGGSSYFQLYYINTILTPDQANYKTQYVEEKYYGYIGQTLGLAATLQVSDYQIPTDRSIWPFSDEVNDAGLFYPNEVRTAYYTRTKDYYLYLSIEIVKSSDTYIYERTVQKLSTIFSYIGGVISSLLTAFFIMNSYTSFAFEYSVANQVFQMRNQQKKINQNQTNQNNQVQNNDENLEKSKGESAFWGIFLFFKYKIYAFLQSTVKKKVIWEDMESLKVCQEEILKQLDITRLLKRIIFLQHFINQTIEEGRLTYLVNTQPKSAQLIQKNRERLTAFYDHENTKMMTNSDFKSEISNVNQPGVELDQDGEKTNQGINKNIKQENYIEMPKNVIEKQQSDIDLVQRYFQEKRSQRMNPIITKRNKTLMKIKIFKPENILQGQNEYDDKEIYEIPINFSRNQHI